MIMVCSYSGLWNGHWRGSSLATDMDQYPTHIKWKKVRYKQNLLAVDSWTVFPSKTCWSPYLCYLGIWPYLQKMRSYWIRVGSNQDTGFIREKCNTDIEGHVNMGAKIGVMQPQKLVERYEHSPSEPSEKLILPATGLPDSGLWDNKFLLFQKKNQKNKNSYLS